MDEDGYMPGMFDPTSDESDLAMLPKTRTITNDENGTGKSQDRSASSNKMPTDSTAESDSWFSESPVTPKKCATQAKNIRSGSCPQNTRPKHYFAMRSTLTFTIPNKRQVCSQRILIFNCRSHKKKRCLWTEEEDQKLIKQVPIRADQRMNT